MEVTFFYNCGKKVASSHIKRDQYSYKSVVKSPIVLVLLYLKYFLL